jgi:hypothetical protein
MQTKYSEEELALLRGELTDQERLGLRLQPEWETSFNSWLDTARPSAIREWMKDEAGLIRLIDSKALQLLLETKHFRQDEVETLKSLFPMWETPEMTDEELNKEIPLTDQESQVAMELLYRVTE